MGLLPGLPTCQMAGLILGPGLCLVLCLSRFRPNSPALSKDLSPPTTSTLVYREKDMDRAASLAKVTLTLISQKSGFVANLE